MIDLAGQMKHLESVVDVSTAYSNCDINHIEEKVYEAPESPRAFLELCKTADVDKLNQPEVTKKIIGSKPNTYIFTKALAESLLESEGRGLPISIIRLSIVTATWKEPVPGWVDNFNVTTGLFALAGQGVLRTIYAK